MRLNKTNIETLPTPTDKPAFHRDDDLKGFGLKVFTSGTKTFFLEKKINGKSKRLTIGGYGELTAEQARKQAVKLSGQIASGGDPVADKAEKKLEAKTLSQVMADYLKARKDLKPRTVTDMANAFKEVCPDWLDKPLTKITPDMVRKRHQAHGEARSEARANLCMRYLRALFNYAIAEYQTAEGKPLVDLNPVKKLSQTKAWYRVDRRQTVIKLHELGAWVNAVLALPGEDIRDYFMTVLLTGMRREEALKLAWKDVDFKAKTFRLIDPKNHQDHTLPMSDYLFDLLARRKLVSVADAVFADSIGRKISNFRYAQAAVTNASGVSFCIHDLRRTFATVAESLDIPAYALKRLLNHANGADVTAGYIVANVERLREPMQKITDFVLKSAGLKETAEVIQLKQARG
jgi:integrase